jgi:protein dithiol oxidoreductase (disulfide-forming)
MKQLFALLVVMLALAACGQEEQTREPVAEQAPVEAESPDSAAEEVAETGDETAEETQEVVEESAAVEETSEDETIILAMADTEAAPREWKFKEGQDYFRLVPTQPTVGGPDKIEVGELFMYSCPHCRNLDPILSKWAAELPPEVRFVRIPAIFNRAAQLHAQMFYTAELLASNGSLPDFDQFHSTVFEEFHQRGNRLMSVDAIERLFARFGVSADDFNKTWNSFPVNQKIRVAADLGRRYGSTSVPSVIVNGKYRVPNTRNVLDVIDELLVREGLR